MGALAGQGRELCTAEWLDYSVLGRRSADDWFTEAAGPRYHEQSLPTDQLAQTGTKQEHLPKRVHNQRKTVVLCQCGRPYRRGVRETCRWDQVYRS